MKMSEAMMASHKPTMNLRFVEREIVDEEETLRKLRVLQQLMVPKDWSRHEEYWEDVPCFKESDLQDQ